MIGGGATARSTVYALSLLGLTSIYILNRDDEGVKYLIALSPKLKNERRLIYLQNPTHVEHCLAKSISPVMLMAMGTIRTPTFFFLYACRKMPIFFSSS